MTASIQITGRTPGDPTLAIHTMIGMDIMGTRRDIPPFPPPSPYRTRSGFYGTPRPQLHGFGDSAGGFIRPPVPRLQFGYPQLQSSGDQR